MEVPDIATIDAGEVDRKRCCSMLGEMNARVGLAAYILDLGW